MGLIVAPAALAQTPWVDYQDQTQTRMVSQADRGISDPREKDYAWGDFDKDGDTDLAVARKQPFTSPGKDPNVLFINENGVLVDRTADFATDSSVAGDQGFLTPTNDRDIVAADVDNDGWLDLITASTYMDSDPKYIGHPRVYMNQGCSGACNGTADWNGFKYEEPRIPTMLSHSGQAGCQPRFCAVDAGDVNGDGYADLWFIDYDNGQPAGCDFNNKLLLNHGASNPGFYHDATDQIGGGFENAAFGASGYVIDMNNDTHADLVKQHAGESRIAFNDASSLGFFDDLQTPYGGSVYFIQVADLNNDPRLDLIASDDGQDRYLINNGNNAQGIPSWTQFVFSYQHFGAGGASGDDGFSGNSIAADLDNDGWDDVLITDNDVDVSGCTRRTHIFKNLGGVPGGNPVLQEQTTGQNCQSFAGNPASCLVASIPANVLEGTHDIAVFDINNDGWKDLVVGRCNSTEIYVNTPPGGPAAAVPDGKSIPGPQLVVDKGVGVGQVLTLDWGESCGFEDNNYAVYEGAIGDFTSHGIVSCNTGGNSDYTFNADPASTYYLVVPTRSSNEGSYGRNSDGVERPNAADPCRPQQMGSCDGP